MLIGGCGGTPIIVHLLRSLRLLLPFNTNLSMVGPVNFTVRPVILSLGQLILSLGQLILSLGQLILSLGLLILSLAS